MTTLADWLSPQTMHALGWTLLHFLWQGAALAALAAAAMAASRNASARYFIGVSGLVLMLATPVATFFVEIAAAHPPSAQPAAYVASGISAAKIPLFLASPFSPASPDALRWLVGAWLIGVVALSLRSAGGFLLIARERRKRFIAVPDSVLEVCITVQERLGITRAIRYCQCRSLQSPAVLGWFRPIVMLPMCALTGLSSEQLESVIAHELAHIKRLDSFVNVFQICVETLLFYHPAIWWLNRRIRNEREHCCDDIAVAVCGRPLEYARALTLMEQWRSAPGLAMAVTGGSLSARITRLLGLKSAGSNMRGAGITASVLCLTTALLAGNALLGVAHPVASVHAAIRSAVPRVASLVQAAAASTPSKKPSPAQNAEKMAPPSSASSYIDGLKSVGLTDLTADQLIALKVQDVTPEYIRGLNEQGLHPGADKIIAMRVQGVTPEYVRGLKDVGLNPDVDRLISLKVQDVTPEYVRDLKAAGVNADAEKIISMKVQDVAPEYVRDIHALGLNPSPDQIISMRVQDVTPQYIKALQAAGFKVSVNEIISARVQDLTPEFIETARKHGFQNLTLEKLLELKRLGVLEAPADI
ncbi:MAG TPA: M56 family metallopeptidase [Candidatus Sulfotelmatobacter sp.]